MDGSNLSAITNMRNTIWDDITALAFTTGYPAEKSEELLELILEASSNSGDLVLDCFAGSGTTLAVAEKLGRRWIGMDCGKLAIYTMQKRLLNIVQSRDLENPNRKYGKPYKPFTLYNAGLYDYSMIKASSTRTVVFLPRIIPNLSNILC